MSVCGLHCSVCDHCLETRKDWLNHLLNSSHQTLAQQGIIEWDSVTRKCAVITFADFPVSCFELLEFFSKGMDIVTDFISIPSKPHCGILQFESRDKVKEVLLKFGREVRIENQTVQLRKTSSYLELEWNQLLQEIEPLYASTLLDKKPSIQISPLSATQVSTQLPLSAAKQVKVKHELEQSVLQNQSPLKSSKTKLMKQFEKIRKLMEIPDEEYIQGLEVMEKMSGIFSPHYPQTKLYMFRYWNVKLRAKETDPLLIFLDYDGELEGEAVNLENRLHTRRVKQFIEEAQPQEIILSKEGQSQSEESEPYGMCFLFLNANVHFKLVTHPWIKLEVQTDRLLQYLCSFDDRVAPLLMLVHYWAKVNGVILSQPEIQINELETTPEPAALNWLVILVLCKQGIIPTPREIISDSGKEIFINKKGIDIGFSINENFVKEWKQKTNKSSSNRGSTDVESVLKLAEIFFSTYANQSTSTGHGYWVFNTRDGEILNTLDFFKKSIQIEQLTKMTEEEIRNVRHRGQKSIRRSHFLHPLYYRHRIAFSPNLFQTIACPRMKITADKLNVFLQTFYNRTGNSFDLKLVFQN